MKIALFVLLAISVSVYATAQHPETAESILKNACAEAATNNKNVFIIFHASWCGWCHKMDSSMNDISCKKFFDDNYVIRHLVVRESKNKKQLENPGAIELLTKHHGADQGIPFWLIFDKDGNLLADCQIRKEGEGLDKKGQNTGCPADVEEVQHLVSVLKQTSRITDDQLQLIEKRFRQNKN